MILWLAWFVDFYQESGDQTVRLLPTAIVLVVPVFLTSCRYGGNGFIGTTRDGDIAVTKAQRERVLHLIDTRWQSEGELYPENTIRQARPYLPVLLSLTEEDIEEWRTKHDPPENEFVEYRVLVLVSQMLLDWKSQDFVIDHFSDIKYEPLKLNVAYVLIHRKMTARSEVLDYLQHALNDPDKVDIMKHLWGAEYLDKRADIEEALRAREETRSGKYS